ncbi:MAG: dicarboxylate/amino acid:cation symporter [Bacteroidales bacterium]|nr:MAG: dicarboxylate/amino acid:cation symporter [Bacteroidales bacterium]
MKRFKLHWQILVALILAIIYGSFFKESVNYVSWMGDLFIRALKMIVIPLIITSLITGVTNVGSSKSLGRLSIKTLVYYISTSILAIVTGLILVNIIKPGAGFEISVTEDISKYSIVKPFKETLINIIPDNIFKAFTSENMLSIIFFSILFGFFILQVQKKHRDLLTDFFSASFKVMMKITLFIIKFAPLGIFGIVAKVIAEQENLLDLFKSIGLFMVVVIAGLIFHAVVTLPSILKLIGRTSPVRFVNSVITPLLTAFSTQSSNATLPLTIEAVEDNAGVSNKISSFTLPLGATINMDGTALYELVVAGFIAQIYGIDLTVSQQVIMVLTALLASIGTAAIPMASLVTMTIIFTAVGLPLEGIAIIMPVERILDMCRTTVNVWSDCCGAATIAVSEGEKLKV